MLYKFILFILIFAGTKYYSFAQQASQEYLLHIKRADSLFENKEYLASAQTFSKGFIANNDKAFVKDRYNAACSWSMANQVDSAFFQLYRIATKGNFKDYFNISTDKDLKNLNSDKRWIPLLKIILKNQEISE